MARSRYKTIGALTLLAVGGVIAISFALGWPAALVGTGSGPDGPQGAVVILIDTVRADHLGCYGYPRPTTPALDRLAEHGVRFEHVVASAPWTLPSVGAMLAGEAPEHAFADKFMLKHSLVEDIAAAGITTSAVTEGGFVSRYYHLNRGFERYVEEEGAVRLAVQGAMVNSAGTGGIATTFAEAKRWLEANTDKRFLLFIHTYEPHTPYDNHDFTAGMPRGGIGETLSTGDIMPVQTGERSFTDEEMAYGRALYDGDVLSADRAIGDFVEFLGRIGLGDRTAVVVTSDHGEELGEHYPSHAFDHGHSLRDNMLMVPLVIHDPTRSFAQGTVAAQVRLIDVMPTVAELLGVPMPEDIAGRSLVPLMRGAETADRLAVSSQCKMGPRRVAIRDGRYKYIEVLKADDGPLPLVPPVPHAQLYDVVSDPGEQHNLAGSQPEVVARLRQQLVDWYERPAARQLARQPEAGDEQHLERLRSLGYVK